MEPQNKTYLHIATFDDNTTDKNFYFMVSNNRCTPGDDDCSGRRFVSATLKANSSEFDGFNNWKIIDLYNDSTVFTFDKRNTNTISLGKYKPGEGKLYKIAPVMQEGGTFVCNEFVTATAFNCNGTVYTGGYDLNIPASSTQTAISFAQDATIKGNNGTNFEIGGGSNRVILQGLNGNKWHGIEVNNCSNVNILNTDIKEIGDANNGAYWASSFYNCANVQVTNCNFNFNLSPKAKAININNYGIGNAKENIIIINNTISVNNSTAAIFVGCSASGYRNLFLMDNTITNGTAPSTYGVMFSNVYSSYIENNTISGFNYGMYVLNTTIDMRDNIITSSRENSTGIFAASLSTINIGLVGNMYSGFSNTITNDNNGCKNINLNNSIFEMNYGNNHLSTNNIPGTYNMFGNGSFQTSDDGPIKFIDAIGNCFNGEGKNALYSITDLNELFFTLRETPHNCNNTQQDLIADFVVPVANNIVDTVYRTTLPQFQNSTPAVLLQTAFYKSLLKKNYDSTKAFGTELLTNYSDSVSTADIISLLYFANTKLADISTNMQSLKTFLEQLIINHTGNLTLVKTANYIIQKCKVNLHQYTSALDGYQDIIAQNPYNYEGLVASWDYAATQLLANTGGAYSNSDEETLNSLVSESQFLVDSLRLNRMIKTDNYDSKVFSKEDRKVLFKSVGNVLKDEREKQVRDVKVLEEKLTKSKGEDKAKVKQKLEDVKNLNTLIKTKKPKDQNEYAVIINNDIEKLNPMKNSNDKSPESLIPKTYALYQNYPNPFNPTTKIAFDLPKDAKVKLVIYDILGREVKTLMNNEFRTAGKYITEFNGSYLSSGIYFARILVNEGKDFIAVKKLVLLK